MIESVPLTVSGERVALGPLRAKLAAVYARWDADVGLSALRLGGGRGDLRPGLEGVDEPRIFADARAPNAAIFTVYETIYDSKAPRPIGVSALRNVDLEHRVADFSIYLGERDAWSTGLGAEASRLTLDFAFHALGLTNVALRARADDTRAIVSFERAGFRPIGRRRGSSRLGQEAHDELYMDAVPTDFESPQLRALFTLSPK